MSKLSLEVNPSHTLAYVDDIRDRLMQVILNQKGVQDVIISFDEDDGIRTWTGSNNESNTIQQLIPQNYPNKKHSQPSILYGVTFFHL